MALARAKLEYLRHLATLSPPQGTTAWLEGRASQFGGSEVAALLGENPYQTMNEMVQNKTSNTRHESVACCFGRLFEPVCKQVLEMLKDWKIEEISCIKSSQFPIAYSPDGVVIDDQQLMLLEIKCPMMRNDLNKIPEYYLPQVKTGMAIMPVDGCYFIQARFRLCSMQHLDDSSRYNRYFHAESAKNVPAKVPIVKGLIYWEPRPHDISAHALKDMGGLTPDYKHKLLVLPSYRNAKIFLNPETKDIPETGIALPFKLFDLQIETVARDPNYLVDNMELIWNGYAELKQIESPFPEKCVHTLVEEDGVLKCEKCCFVKSEELLQDEFVKVIPRDHDHYSRKEYLKEKIERLAGVQPKKKLQYTAYWAQGMLLLLKKHNPETWLETRRLLSKHGFGDLIADLPYLAGQPVYTPTWVQNLLLYIYHELKDNLKFEYILAACLSVAGRDASWVPLTATPATLKKYNTKWREIAIQLGLPLVKLNIKKIDWVDTLKDYGCLKNTTWEEFSS